MCDSWLSPVRSALSIHRRGMTQKTQKHKLLFKESFRFRFVQCCRYRVRVYRFMMNCGTGFFGKKTFMLSRSNFWPPRNFGALEPELSSFENARFVVVPVPYDSTTTWRSGTREGANAILDASMNMELFDVELQREICNAGIHTTDDVEPDMRSPQHMAVRVTEVIGEILFAGKFPILLGGEHSLTFGAVTAALKLPLDGDLTVVQLDAHTDLRDGYCNTKWGHGCVARRISELPGARIVQVGLRSTSQEEYSSVPANVTQFWCEDVLNDFSGTLGQILAVCSENVYLTFDVDVCDPSWVSATGTPEPGGLSYYQVRDLLRAICTQKNVLGLDCVELIGGDSAAAFAVARLLYKAMGYLSMDSLSEAPGA
jgi:agmatinase